MARRVEEHKEQVPLKIYNNELVSNCAVCVGPQNFVEVRFLGRGSHGRVYSVRSVVCPLQSL